MENAGENLKREIREERLRRPKAPMWFYDEPEEVWQAFRKEAEPVEREYLELRVALRDAETALRAAAEDEHLQARVKYLRRRLEDLEKLAPWISSDHPTEVLLWGIPHG